MCTKPRTRQGIDVYERNQLLRAARERTPSQRLPEVGMSRQELAEAVNSWVRMNAGRPGALDAHYVARLERGAVRWPSAEYRAGFRAILGVHDDTDIGFFSRRRPVQLASSDAAQSTLETTDAIEAWELTDALTRYSIGSSTLDQLERAVLGCATRYPSAGPGALLPVVERQLRRLRQALLDPQPLSVRRRSVVLLGMLCGLAGNLWLDLAQQDRAADFLDVAEQAAQEAEDSDLAAWVLATRAIGHFFADMHDQAVLVLGRADEHAAVRSSPRRRSWVAALSARAAAAAGNRRDALESLDQAYLLMDQVSDPPIGTEFFDLPRLDGIAGSTYLLAADTDRAASLLCRARDHRATHDAKGRALLTLDLAECRIVSREPDEAARLVGEALETAHGALVSPIIIRTRSLVARLDSWAEPKAVRELNSRLKDLARD